MSAGGAAQLSHFADNGDAIARDGTRFFQVFDEKFNPDRYYDYDPEQPLIHWGESYMLTAYVNAFDVSRDRAVGEFAKKRIEKVLSVRSDRKGVKDEIRDRSVPGWCNNRYTAGKMHAHLVGTGMITYPIARWCWIVKQDPMFNDLWGLYADVCIKDIRESLDAFEYAWHDGPGDNEGYYKDLRYVDESSAKRLMESLANGPDSGLYVAPFDILPLPFNQQNAAGRTHVMLWKLTGDEQYLERATRLAHFLKNRMRIEDDAYIWPYAAYNGRLSTSDTSHAGLDIDFMYLCYQSGIVFTESDMDLLVARFNRIYDEKRGFATDLSGSYAEGHQEPSMYMWQCLGELAPDLRSKIHQFYMKRWDRGVYNETGDQLTAINMVKYRAPTARTTNH